MYNLLQYLLIFASVPSILSSTMPCQIVFEKPSGPYLFVGMEVHGVNNAYA